MKLVDSCNLTLIAGNGGDGVIAWRREAHNDKGGPAGGDGGKGGDVVFVADHNVLNLQKLQFSPIIEAESGKNGMPELMTGKSGSDTIINVPIGTSIYDKNNNLICDLVHDQQSYVICRGGKPGRGNAKFKSASNRVPQMYERGDLGESKEVFLKLKYLSNVGIVGYPNAGKSTLISIISNAKAKIANYEFTTLNPILGSVNYKDKSLIFADIPGLIENASEGRGLGHDFLKHIERCEILVHLISANPDDFPNAVEAYKIVRKELEKYSEEVLNKKVLIVVNKKDIKGSEQQYHELLQYLKLDDILFISAKNNDLGKFLEKVFSMYENIYLEKKEDDNKNKIFERHYFVDQENDDLKKIDEANVSHPDGQLNVWKINHQRVSYWLHKIPLTTNDNIFRFNQKLKTLGVEEILYKLGAKSTDSVIIDNHLFSLNDLN